VVHHIGLHIVESTIRPSLVFAGMAALYGLSTDELRLINDISPAIPYNAKVYRPVRLCEFQTLGSDLRNSLHAEQSGIHDGPIEWWRSVAAASRTRSSHPVFAKHWPIPDSPYDYPSRRGHLPLFEDVESTRFDRISICVASLFGWK